MDLLTKISEIIEENNLPVLEYSVINEDGLLHKVYKGNGSNNIYSISKNFTALALLQLIAEKKISDEDNIFDLFCEEYEMNQAWKKVRIKHVLTQRTGIGKAFLDLDCDDISTYKTVDYLKIVFDSELVYPAGEKFVYSDSNYYLIGRIVQKVSHMYLDEYLLKYIFGPIGINHVKFVKDPFKHPAGGTGISLSSSDLAKFGYMLLNEGIYQGKRIISLDVFKMIQNSFILIDEITEYGYSFWRRGHIMYGNGMYGQLMFFAKSKQTVIVVESLDYENKIDTLFTFLLNEEKNIIT